MKKAFFVYFCAILWLTSIITSIMLQADELPQLNHIPPESIEKAKSFYVELNVFSGLDQIKEVYLFYKKANLGYIQIEMLNGSEMNPYYKAEIPGDFIDQRIEYYFRIHLINGEEFTLPKNDAMNNPYQVELKPVIIKSTVSAFKKLSPTDEFNFTTRDFLVAISYFAIEDEIEGKTIKLFFDGMDVSGYATITSNLLVYKPDRIIPGIHTIEIIIYNNDGSVYDSQKWIVEVKSEKITQKLPISVNGDFYAVSRFRSTSAQDSSYYYDEQNDWKNFGRLNLYGSKDWFRYNGRIYLSSDESKTRQPVNRYAFEMHIPHFSMHLGDHTQTFNNTTINGKNVRGISGVFDYGIIKLHSFYGQIKRNIKGRDEIIYGVDTTSVPYDTVPVDTTIIEGSYKRNCFGLRLQLGNERKLAFGLAFLKVKDDVSSEKFATNPKDNIIFSIDSKLALFRQKLVFGAEISTSILNNDISTGAISEQDLDTLDVELPFTPSSVEDIFVINEHMVPLIPSLNSIAGEIYTRAFFYNNLLNIRYSYVGGSYNSLANPYLQKDIAGINISNTYRLLNNQLSLTAGYNSYQDNLNDNKFGTTNSKGFYCSMNYFPLVKDVYLPCVNINYQQSTRKKSVADTSYSEYSIDQFNNTIGFSTSYEMPTTRYAKTRFSISISNSNSVDNEKKSFDSNSQNYLFSINSNFNDIPLTSKFSIGYMKTEDKPDTTEKTSNDYLSFSFREEYSFIPDKLNTYFDYHLLNYGGDEKQTKNCFTLGGNHKFNLFRTETYISGELAYLLYKNSTLAERNYNQTEFRLKISQKF